LAAAADEPELALREGARLVPRLVRATGSLTVPGEGAWRLGVERGGTLEDLMLLPNPDAERELGLSEVRVAVHAAGLNFRDVLLALGMYPGEAPLGGDAAGVVVEAGAEVGDLAVGDRVMGL